MEKILTIDFKSKNAPVDFVKSLSSTGFAVIQNHGIDSSLINDTYKDWKLFFNSDIKHNYLFDLNKQDGYFPLNQKMHKVQILRISKNFFIYIGGEDIQKK